MPTNFELKRLKPKLDIVEKPGNRVHKLTDSNVSHPNRNPGDHALQEYSPSGIVHVASLSRIEADHYQQRFSFLPWANRKMTGPFYDLVWW